MTDDWPERQLERREEIFLERARGAEKSPLRPERHRIGTHAAVETFVIDIEATNRCNASCQFCPRDRTPHQGLMTRETLEQVLARAVEFRGVVEDLEAGVLDISFCGLGEGILHPDLSTFVRRSTEEGFDPCLCSNGHLLDEARSEALLDAGLSQIFLNVAEVGGDYDRIYGLPFAVTLANVEAFIERARGRCEVWIVLVDHRMDPEHVAGIRQFWSDRGIRCFYPSPMLNRAGAIDHETLRFDDHPMEAAARRRFAGEIPGCSAPAQCLVIGYDGRFYLCNSDWEKKEPAGTVYELSILESMRQKLERARNRDDAICRQCNHEPLNQISRLLADDAPDVLIDQGVEMLRRKQHAAAEFVTRAESTGHLAPAEPRRLIPVSAVGGAN